jgi:GAF domain-containing protein
MPAGADASRRPTGPDEDAMAPLPFDELTRLTALHALRILDTPPEAVFDEAVALAAELCAAPISLVSLVDESRQWFKARIGTDLCETAREYAFCGRAIAQEGLFEVPDALADPRFVDNPLVTGKPFVRYYAGVPLVIAGGAKIGTLCVIDVVPRRLTAAQARALVLLAGQLSAILDQRYALQLAGELRDRQAGLYERLLLEAMAVAERRALTLHEGIAQDLAGAQLLLAGIGDPGDGADLSSQANRLALLKRIIGTAIDDCRGLAADEGSLTLRSEGLRGALLHLAARQEEASGHSKRIRAATASVGSQRYARVIEHQLYRIAGAALRWACDHAATTTVTIALEWRDEALELSVIDDGGSPPAAAAEVLEVLRFRAALIDGVVRVADEPGRHAVLVRVPCRPLPPDGSGAAATPVA